ARALRHTDLRENLLPDAERVHALVDLVARGSGVDVAERLGPEVGQGDRVVGVEGDLEGGAHTGTPFVCRYRSRSRQTSDRWWMSSRLMCSTSTAIAASGYGSACPTRTARTSWPSEATPSSQVSSCAFSWTSASAGVPAYSQDSYEAGGAPKCAAFRAASTPTITCPRRQAMVVNGAGSGSGKAKSMVKSPAPAWTGAVDVPRGWMFQAPDTGDQKYSSSVSPARRRSHSAARWKVICSSSSW